MQVLILITGGFVIVRIAKVFLLPTLNTLLTGALFTKMFLRTLLLRINNVTRFRSWCRSDRIQHQSWSPVLSCREGGELGKRFARDEQFASFGIRRVLSLIDQFYA